MYRVKQQWGYQHLTKLCGARGTVIGLSWKREGERKQHLLAYRKTRTSLSFTYFTNQTNHARNVRGGSKGWVPAKPMSFQQRGEEGVMPSEVRHGVFSIRVCWRTKCEPLRKSITRCWSALLDTNDVKNTCIYTVNSCTYKPDDGHTAIVHLQCTHVQESGNKYLKKCAWLFFLIYIWNFTIGTLPTFHFLV